MAITVTDLPLQPLSERFRTLLQHVFARSEASPRLPGDLRHLPDHLLLDIGIDPRTVPSRIDDNGIARPDLAHDGVAASTLRTTAR